MRKRPPFWKSTSSIFLAFLLTVSSPVLALASDSDTVASSASSQSQSVNATPPADQPQKPDGPDADTYTYNSDTGMWENDHFIWDPATHQATPKDPLLYTYNSITNTWDATAWQYNSDTGKYEPYVISTKTKPADDLIAPSDSLPTSETESTPASPANTNTATNSDPVQPATNNQSNLDINQATGAQMDNTITSGAQSGDADVKRNTQAGDAASGNTLAMANVINLLQSSTSFTSGKGNGELVVFESNIQGDVVGDLLVDPGAIAKLQPVSQASPTNPKIEVNTHNDAQINNDIDLSAQSGNVNLTENTIAGNGTSGSANAVANVVNLANSAVGAGQSFLGMINIYGNFDGDILLPPGFIDSLLASNDGSQPGTPTSDKTSLNIDVDNNQAVVNRVKATAASGNAISTANTTAGDAKTGAASTNITILNLTGSEVVGKNDLLVFVNVLGKWVGLIVNAPSGATAAELGGNATQNNTLLPSDTSINDDNHTKINNDISVAAASGDVTARRNTTVGNLTTGDASASVNLLNIINSSLSLSDWFGILFINVFGTWNGSFGIDTAAGGPSSSNPPATNGGGSSKKTPPSKLFRFRPTATQTAPTSTTTSLYYYTQPVSYTTNHPQPSQTHHKAVLGTASTDQTPPSDSGSHSNLLIPILGVLIAIAMLGTEKWLAIRAENRALKPRRIVIPVRSI